ncbi:MAG: type II toxin-antitoxin system PemK/MazF family toxin [Pyrinomonadaceae bacterium]
MKPGTVVTVDFRGATGTKRRPAVIVSTPTYHTERPDVILAVVTSQTAKASAASDYVLRDWALANLAKPSAVRIFLNTSLAASVQYIGELSDHDWTQVQARLKLAIAFE